MNGTEYLNSVHKNTRQLRANASHLFTLAEAFDMTGNHDMSERMTVLGENLIYIANDLDASISSYVHSEFQESQRMTGHVLSALLSKADGGA